MTTFAQQSVVYLAGAIAQRKRRPVKPIELLRPFDLC